MKIAFTILGEPASKANSRQLVSFGRKPAWREFIEEMVSQASDATEALLHVDGWVAKARALLAADDTSRVAIIKSKKAREYEKAAVKQIPESARVMLEGPVRVTLRISYASERPDLDPSIVLDVLQAKFVKGSREVERAGVYRNDRQVRELHVFHAIDRGNPRCEIEVEAMAPQQVNLALPESNRLASIDDPFRACA